MNTVQLSRYSNDQYKPGGRLKRIAWYFFSEICFRGVVPFSSVIKVKLLRIFGAKIGQGVVIKPNVNIKYPWFLEIGDFCWIGEGVWIDNLTLVRLDNNVVLSQGSYLLTGNHNYRKKFFDLMLGEIIIEDGVWIGAKSIVCPGVVCESHSVLSVGSVATKKMEQYAIYQGNPAEKKKHRKLTR